MHISFLVISKDIYAQGNKLFAHTQLKNDENTLEL